jgi:hypothetical protein
MEEWLPQETGTHQDHVIAHVIGATVLGALIFDEAAHLLLDIGFIWTIFLDGEMGLLPQSMAISELSLDEEEKIVMLEEVRRLHDGGRSAAGFAHWSPSAVECLIVTVEFYGSDERRLLLISGEEASIAVESSLETREISVAALTPDEVAAVHFRRD